MFSVRMSGVRDYDVEVKRFIHQPGESGQEEVVEGDGTHLAQDLQVAQTKLKLCHSN